MFASASLEITGSGGGGQGGEPGGGRRARSGSTDTLGSAGRDERVRSRRIVFQFVVGHGPWNTHLCCNMSSRVY